MRAAICFSGQPRYIEETSALIINNLVKINNPDIFIHTWVSEDDEDLKSELQNRILSIYPNAIINIEPSKKFDIKSLKAQNRQGTYSMFYSIFKANQIKTQREMKFGTKYDYVMRCRFDLLVTEVIDFSKLDRNYINVPDNFPFNKNYFNDQIAISGSENMDIYTDTFNFLDEYFTLEDKYNAANERILGYHVLKINKLKIKKSINEDHCRIIHRNYEHKDFFFKKLKFRYKELFHAVFGDGI